MMDVMTRVSAILTPQFMLTLGSNEITDNISDRLINLSLTDNRGFESDQLDIELDDIDGLVELPVRHSSVVLTRQKRFCCGRKRNLRLMRWSITVHPTR